MNEKNIISVLGDHGIRISKGINPSLKKNREKDSRRLKRAETRRCLE